VLTTRVYLAQYSIKKKENGWGKGENNFNVGGINEVILHPSSNIWGKGENNSMLGELMR
jgi:hypothetical protein